MKFFKFQWVMILFAIAFSLSGCARYANESEFSKSSLSNTSDTEYAMKTNVNYHIVKRGETLFRIARLYGLNYRDIAAWNAIYPPYTIFPNQQLLIYTAPVGNVDYGKSYSRFVPANYQSEFDSPKTPYLTSSNYSGYYVSPSNYRTPYVVPLNVESSTPVYDTPSAILSSSDDSYYEESQGKSAFSVAPATKIPLRAIPQSNFHTVGKNENLASIAELYGLTTYDLAAWNGMNDSYTVYPGQQLLIVAP